MSEFDGVVPALGLALTKRGYTTLTPVQKAMLAPDLASADALVSAQTGSGKTVAFGLALAPSLFQEAETFGPAEAERPQALIVAPTRELALQVKRELGWLYEQTGAMIVSCVGGMDPRLERRALERGCHIVVGTPGRLCDHIRRGGLDPSALKAVALDEADEMLDLGFREDLEFILEATPEERRTLLFSATVPASIAKLAKQYQRDAIRVTTAEEKEQHVDIDYRVLAVAARERENAIINVLRYYEVENALIFCNTRAAVNHMVARLNNRGFQVVALSGELSQNERSHALQALRDGRARVCVATDVAARGIDLPKLELVIHAELPTNPETLLHRSGRTGRAGRKGISALIVDNKGRSRAERLLRSATINATWTTPPSADAVNRRDEERIMADPVLYDPLEEEERAFAGRLLARHTPEQVAAALLRLKRAGQSAPEDLQEVSFEAPDEKHAPAQPRKTNSGFEDSVWFSLSIGRKQNAEPRWLIPMICKAANITKRDIGTITIDAEETFVQLDANHADHFFNALGKNRTIEGNIRVKPLSGMPKTGERSAGKSTPTRAERAKNAKKSGHRKTQKAAPKAAGQNAKPKKTNVWNKKSKATDGHNNKAEHKAAKTKSKKNKPA